MRQTKNKNIEGASEAKSPNFVSNMRIKVCGMTDLKQVKELDKIGVEFCGFIFYPKSPRYVMNFTTTEAIKKLKGKINKVGVFANATTEEVLKTVDDCGLYLVQLHGDEKPKDCEKISNYITVVKAFRLTEDENILWKIKDYQDVVDMFLFDTEGIGYGGTGKKFDWNVLKGMDIGKPFFLSGGIEPTDAEELQEFSKDSVTKRLFSLDINSKFEISIGVKNTETIKKFVNAIRN